MFSIKQQTPHPFSKFSLWENTEWLYTKVYGHFCLANDRGWVSISHKRNRSDSILRYGDETQEAWKPLLNMLPVLRGSSEWLAQLESERFLLWLALFELYHSPNKNDHILSYTAILYSLKEKTFTFLSKNPTDHNVRQDIHDHRCHAYADYDCSESFFPVDAKEGCDKSSGPGSGSRKRDSYEEYQPPEFISADPITFAHRFFLQLSEQS